MPHRVQQFKTAELIAEGRDEKKIKQWQGKELISGGRGALHCHIPIHSLRISGFLAHQDVIFGQTGETLTLSLHNIDRIAYMPGVLLACEKVLTLHHLFYGLEHIMDL